MATSQVMRITLKAYDHQLVDASAKKIIETVKKNGSQVSGPVPLPTKREVVTILRAVHKYKDSREQFEQRTHKRLIDIIMPTPKTVDALQRLEMPAGVFIGIKICFISAVSGQNCYLCNNTFSLSQVGGNPNNDWRCTQVQVNIKQIQTS